MTILSRKDFCEIVRILCRPIDPKVLEDYVLREPELHEPNKVDVVSLFAPLNRLNAALPSLDASSFFAIESSLLNYRLNRQLIDREVEIFIYCTALYISDARSFASAVNTLPWIRRELDRLRRHESDPSRRRELARLMTTPAVA